MLEYVIGLASGHIDYLPRLPEPLLLKIIEYLHLEDISQLSQVSKMFRKVSGDIVIITYMTPNPYSTGIDSSRQNLMSVDVRF